MDLWLAIPLLLGVIALGTKGLDKLSAVTGVVIGYMLLFTGGWQWFMLLMIFFTTGTLATKFKYATKSKKKLSQKTRGVENVLANALVALFFALQGNLIGFAASIAAATSDTLSSEIGVLSNRPPVSVLNWRKEMKRGENGGVSLLGNAAMVFGALIIAVSYFLLFGDIMISMIIFVAGISGSVIDSILGITLENEGVIGNHLVNFFCTFGAALIAMALASLL